MTGPASRTGVLVMAHGTPATTEGIEPFYTAIRHGRRPDADLLAELVGRYQAIGGTSPLTGRTAAQVAGLAAVLESGTPGGYVVRYGSKYTDPSIEAGMAALLAEGVDRVVGLVLTPHESALGSGEYLRRAGAAAASAIRPPAVVPVASWHRAPGLASLLADRTAAALASLPTERRVRPVVFFSAHSLPQRALTEGDPYPTQVEESAADIAAVLGLDRESGPSWSVAWQSAGRTPEPWLGPDLLSQIRRVAAEGATSVVVCPVGFVSDHLEILYDLDIEAAGVAGRAGVAFTRTRSLNDDPRFLAILADVVRDAARAPRDATAGDQPAAPSAPGRRTSSAAGPPPA
ncbi:MAG TPA: ferrochelatase [Acidimicrobiales bacterium]|jgi:ferrochelatase|nr:ferrochelatase [Acidimicrobiales bacterium]